MRTQKRKTSLRKLEDYYRNAHVLTRRAIIVVESSVSAKPYRVNPHYGINGTFTTPKAAMAAFIKQYKTPLLTFDDPDELEEYVYDMFEEALEAGRLDRCRKIISDCYPDRLPAVERFLAREEKRLLGVLKQTNTTT